MAIKNERTIKEVLDTDEFELPIGYVDSNGNFHKTVKLQEMTGEVEEAIADAKVRTNGAKIITEAISGVVERLGSMKKFTKNDARNLYVADRDFIILMNHKVSIGDEIEWTEECPRCNGRFDITVEIDNIPIKYATQDEPKIIEIELPNGIKDAEGKVYKKLKVSYPTGMVQERIFPLLQQNPSQAVTQMLALITEDIEGLSHWNYETFRKMTKKDRKAISDALAEKKIGADMNPEVQCASCGYKYKTTIPVMTLLGE